MLTDVLYTRLTSIDYVPGVSRYRTMGGYGAREEAPLDPQRRTESHGVHGSPPNFAGTVTQL